MTSEYNEDSLKDFPELKTNLDKSEVKKLIKEWKSEATSLSSKFESKWEENKRAWKGEQINRGVIKEDDGQENRMFTGTETFLPILTRQNPEPVVEHEDKQLALAVNDELYDIVDTQKLKLKIKAVTRNWMFYRLGILQIIWDAEEEQIKFKALKASDVYLDPKAQIEGGQYYGRYIGVKCSKIKRDLEEEYPEIKGITGNPDSMIDYVQWWTPDHFIIDIKGNPMFVMKNPYFNYESEKEEPDEYGEMVFNKVDAKNHFKRRQIPFSFLSVYNVDEQVFDDTSLIEQANINQKKLNKRVQQIDKNVDNQNNSVVFYGLDEQKASTALKQLQKGGAIVLNNRQTEGAERIGGNALTGDVYNDAQIQRGAIDAVFATNAVTRGEQTSDTTVRGKIIARQSDESRIGFISEYVEQMVDYALNWAVQLMYVYGEDRELLPETPMIISIKEGSMIPKDPLTQRNEAIDLFNAGAIDILSLYEKLNVDNPQEVALRAFLYKTDPMIYAQQVLGFNPEPQALPEMPEQGMPEMPGMPQEVQEPELPQVDESQIPLTQM